MLPTAYSVGISHNHRRISFQAGNLFFGAISVYKIIGKCFFLPADLAT
jgi:hypothetical protein